MPCQKVVKILKKVAQDNKNYTFIHGNICDNMYEVYNNLKLKEANDIISKMDLSNNSTVLLVPFSE